jgi:hypothetical protein
MNLHYHFRPDVLDMGSLLQGPGDMNQMTEIVKRCLSLGFALPVIFAGGARRNARTGQSSALPPKVPTPMPLPSPPPPARPSLTGFSGTVVRHGPRFALREIDGDLYALDSTGLAWPFEGEQVLISGYLSPDTGLLHICTIEEVDDLRAEAV